VPTEKKIELRTLAGSFTGSATALYPQLELVDKTEWSWDIYISSIQFSTSLVVYPSSPADPTDMAGMVITLGKQSDPLAIGDGLESVITHFTQPNSIVGPPAFPLPSSKVSTIPFDGCGFFLPAKSPISLYAFGPVQTSGNLLDAIASIQYRRV